MIERSEETVEETEVPLPSVDEAIARIDKLFRRAFQPKEEIMRDWAAIRNALDKKT